MLWFICKVSYYIVIYIDESVLIIMVWFICKVSYYIVLIIW